MGRSKGGKKSGGGASEAAAAEVEAAAATAEVEPVASAAEEEPQAKRSKNSTAEEPAVVLVPVPVVAVSALPANLSIHGAAPEQPGLVAASAQEGVPAQTQLVMHTTGAGTSVLAVRRPPQQATQKLSAPMRRRRSPQLTWPLLPLLPQMPPPPRNRR